MPVMATSSSGSADASLRRHTGLLRVLPHHLHDEPHHATLNAAIAPSVASLQPERCHRPCSTMIQSLWDAIPPFTAPFQRFPASRYACIRAYESPMRSKGAAAATFSGCTRPGSLETQAAGSTHKFVQSGGDGVVGMSICNVFRGFETNFADTVVRAGNWSIWGV